MLSLNRSVYFGGTQLHPISTYNNTTFQKIYLSSNKHNFNPFQVRTQMGKLRLNLHCYDENKNPSKLLKKVTYLRGQDTWFSFPSEMCKIVQFRRIKGNLNYPVSRNFRHFPYRSPTWYPTLILHPTIRPIAFCKNNSECRFISPTFLSKYQIFGKWNSNNILE